MQFWTCQEYKFYVKACIIWALVAGTYTAAFAAQILAQDKVATNPSPLSVTDNLVLVVKARNEVTMASKGNARISRLIFRTGDLVNEHEAVFELDPMELFLEKNKLEHEVNVAKIKSEDDSAVKASEANLRSRNFTYQQLQALQKSASGVRVAPLELERARNSAEEAKANLDSALSEARQAFEDYEARKVDQKILTQKLNDYRAKSPFSGQVLQIFRDKGDFVETGQPIATLYRMDVVEGVVNLDSKSIPPQEAIGISLAVDWGENRAGLETKCKITRITPKVESDGRYQAICEIKNVKGKVNGSWALIPGMTFKARAVKPEQALLRTDSVSKLD